MIVSVSGKTHLERSTLCHVTKLTHWNDLFKMDLYSILKFLENIFDDLCTFCAQLNIPYKILRCAEKNFPQDIERQKVEVVSWWMTSTDLPCWWHLVHALRRMDRNDIADRINMSHRK